MSIVVAYVSLAAIVLCCSLWLRRVSIVCLLLLSEALWFTLFGLIAGIAVCSRQPSVLMFSFVVLCFSAAELANTILGLTSAAVVAALF